MKFFSMNDSSHTVESTSPKSRVRVESESFKKCDSSRLESESKLGLAQPCFVRYVSRIDNRFYSAIVRSELAKLLP